MQHINSSHDLGLHGTLHTTSHTGLLFNDLRNLCNETPCDATHELGVDNLNLLPQLRSVLQQKFPNEKMLFTKLPDGYVIHTPSNAVLSLLKDEHMKKPKHVQNELDGSEHHVVAYSITTPPHLTDKVLHFRLMKDHDGILPANAITNYSNIDHAIAKVASAVPLSSTPRVIYTSPNLGTLNGFMLKGNSANSLKNTFFSLIDKTGTNNMYDTPIKLPADVASLLCMNPEKMICVAPLQNGILGYRNRKKDDGQTLIFLANSNDFHMSSPVNDNNSTVQVFKMNYASKDHDAPRIFVNTRNTPVQSAKCRFNTPPIILNNSVQDCLNHIDYAMRKAQLQHSNIEEYPEYCKVMKMLRAL